IILQKNPEQLQMLQIEFARDNKEVISLIEHIRELHPSVLVEIGTCESRVPWMLSQHLLRGVTIINIDFINGSRRHTTSRSKKMREAAKLREQGFEVHLL